MGQYDRNVVQMANSKKNSTLWSFGYLVNERWYSHAALSSNNELHIALIVHNIVLHHTIVFIIIAKINDKMFQRINGILKDKVYDYTFISVYL